MRLSALLVTLAVAAPLVACAPSRPGAQVVPTAVSPSSIAAACAEPERRAFDFWPGDWDLVVRARSTPDAPWTEARGSNHVTSTLGGCVIEERFVADGPGAPWAGHSVSQWVKGEKAWRQTWVDDSGGYLPFRGGMVDGEMILTGEPKADGKVMRMVFTAITHEHFTWRWEGASDGKTWTPVMTIDYRRRG